MKKILYFIQLPPPLYGVTVINSFVYNNIIINKELKKDLLEIRFSSNLEELGKMNIQKMLTLLSLNFKLIRKILFFKPDYIYFTVVPTGFGFYRDLFFISIMKLFRIKIIYHLHGKGIKENSNSKFKKKLYEFAFKNSNIIHLSKGLLEKDFNHLSLGKCKKFYLENFVPKSKIIKNNNIDNCINLLFLANLQASKGLFILLKAMIILSKNNTLFKLTIIGNFRDSETEKISHDIIKKNNLEKFIFFVGAKYDIEKINYFNKADLFIYPTLKDAFPLVLLEAFSYAIPVISTNEGAIDEIIDNDNNGYIVEKNDVNALVEKISYLNENRDKLNLFSKNAYASYEKRFKKETFETNMKNILEIIDK